MRLMLIISNYSWYGLTYNYIFTSLYFHVLQWSWSSLITVLVRSKYLAFQPRIFIPHLHVNFSIHKTLFASKHLEEKKFKRNILQTGVVIYNNLKLYLTNMGLGTTWKINRSFLKVNFIYSFNFIHIIL